MQQLTERTITCRFPARSGESKLALQCDWFGGAFIGGVTLYANGSHPPP
ncbi:hypothetical protein KCP70_10395 [Salmonella enterica subsp. enterica]|nr:hypothetical protein KCP70_10395 [Salmonella enterica subsp. enterica]